jgi:hypothetical protein
VIFGFDTAQVVGRVARSYARWKHAEHGDNLRKDTSFSLATKLGDRPAKFTGFILLLPSVDTMEQACFL